MSSADRLDAEVAMHAANEARHESRQASGTPIEVYSEVQLWLGGG